MNNNKKKTIIILISTILLGIIAIFTGIKLYRLRQERISTTKPKAEEVDLYGCGLHFVVNVSPTASPSATPTPTPIPGCWDECTPEEGTCPEELECQEIDEVYRCVNPECPEEESCQCPEPSATPTPTPIPGCWDECTLGDENSCSESLECQEVGETYRCVNPECPEEEDCQCPEPSATPTEVPPTETPAGPTATLAPGQPTYTPTPPEALPDVGSIWPTIGVTLGGIILGIIGFLLAL